MAPHHSTVLKDIVQEAADAVVGHVKVGVIIKCKCHSLFFDGARTPAHGICGAQDIGS
jgi:hypothetical protein